MRYVFGMKRTRKSHHNACNNKKNDESRRKSLCSTISYKLYTLKYEGKLNVSFNILKDKLKYNWGNTLEYGCIGQ